MTWWYDFSNYENLDRQVQSHLYGLRQRRPDPNQPSWQPPPRVRRSERLMNMWMEEDDRVGRNLSRGRIPGRVYGRDSYVVMPNRTVRWFSNTTRTWATPYPSPTQYRSADDRGLVHWVAPYSVIQRNAARSRNRYRGG